MAAIYRRERINGKGWRYVRVNLGRGRRPAEAPPYYVRFTVGGKRKWSDPYDTLKDAQEAAETLPDVIEAQSKNMTLGELTESRNANRIAVKSAVDTYLTQKASKAPKTRLQYTRALSEFLEALVACKVRFLDEISEAVLRKYKIFMETRKYAGKTIDTRLNIVYFLLRKNGVTARLPRDEMPTVEEETAVPYTDEEIKKMFASMDEESLIRYKFFLGTGCRDKEVTFAAWNDIDFAKREYHIRRKEDVGFTPKSHESRTVPLPVSLVDALKARRKKHPDDRWLFVNERGEPDNHFLRKLKRIALHAGLNCGQCRTTITTGKYDRKKLTEVTCKTQPVCEHIYLHRFRKTCATRWQEHGIPLRTIQAWLGHKNLETTQKYLGVTDSGKLRPQIDAAFGD
jgi:integrase/recombinase XerD